MRESCGDLGKSSEDGGNSHCKGPRSGARLVHFRMCEKAGCREGVLEGRVVQLRSERSTLNAEQQLQAQARQQPFSAWSLSPDHRPPREVESPSCSGRGSRRGMRKVPRVAQLAKGRARQES